MYQQKRPRSSSSDSDTSVSDLTQPKKVSKTQNLSECVEQKLEECLQEDSDSEISGLQVETVIMSTRDQQDEVTMASLVKILATLATKEDIKNMQKDFKNGIKCVTESIVKVQDDVVSFSKQLQETNKSLEYTQKEVRSLNDESKAQVEKIKELEVVNLTLKHQNEELKQKYLHLESYTRRENLILERVEEKDDEDTEKVVRDLLIDQFEMDSVPEIVFQAVHRLGKKSPLKAVPYQRPIIMKFLLRRERMKVWKLRYKLEGTNIRLREDYPEDIEKQRRRMYPIVREAKRKKFVGDVYIAGANLYVNKQRYTVDTLYQLPDSINPRHLGTKDTGNMMLFYGRFSPYSNFHPATFDIDGKKYGTVEQYYQWSKAKKAGDDINANLILGTDDPVQQKHFGGRVLLNNKAWLTGPAREVMKTAVYAKFSQNSDLKHQLLATGEKVMVECNPYDSFWSCGLGLRDEEATDRAGWKGNNWLGVCLSDVREMLH